MRNFLYRHRHKLLLLVVIFVSMITLTSCRQNSGYWYSHPYTTWGNEFKFTGFFDGFFGWPVSIISYPVAWLFHAIGTGLGNSFFWGLFFTTIIVRTVGLPLYLQQSEMMYKTQLLQPEMEKINKKYMYRKDPQSQAEQKREMAVAYKKAGINPIGCIASIFFQFPIFISVYEVVKRINLSSVTIINGVAVEQVSKFYLSNTKLFGYFELYGTSATQGAWHDRIFCIFIAAIYIVIQYFSQKYSQKKPSFIKQNNNPQKANQQQNQAKQFKYMNIIMLVMFGFFALSSTALAIYWLFAGLYQFGAQVLVRKIHEKRYANKNIIEQKEARKLHEKKEKRLEKERIKAEKIQQKDKQKKHKAAQQNLINKNNSITVVPKDKKNKNNKDEKNNPNKG